MKNKYLLIGILLIAAALRFYLLGEIPVGFHRDEAFLGYNAYSIMKTGKEMSGELLPIHLKSFLYSPAGYSYFSIPFIALFGLNEFAVRFSSAFFGTLTVLITYFLTRAIFNTNDKSTKNSLEIGIHSASSGRDWKLEIPIVAAALLAISPWHINLSRVATENVLVVFFISLATLFYLKWVKKEKIWLLIFSFLCFGMTLFLYQAPRAFLPLFLPLLIIFSHQKLLNKKIIMPALLFLIVIIIPIISILSSHDLTQRIRMLSIFQNPATQLVLDEQIREDGGSNVLITRFFHNKIINYSSTFFYNYFTHFSYDFLFTDKGLPDRYRVPQMGLLYFFELPLIIFGIWGLFSLNRRLCLFLISWILLAPLGSAFTYDDIPNLQRVLIIFPALSIISGYGLLSVFEFFSKKKFAKFAYFTIILLIMYGIISYIHQYFSHQVNHRPWRRQEGSKTLVSRVNDLQSKYKKIVITDEESSPSIFFMFYNKYNPAIIQNKLLSKPTNSYGLISFEKYEFVHGACPLHVTGEMDLVTKKYILSGEKGVLYVNSVSCEIPDKRIKVISDIKRSDGTVVFSLQTIK